MKLQPLKPQNLNPKLSTTLDTQTRIPPKPNTLNSNLTGMSKNANVYTGKISTLEYPQPERRLNRNTSTPKALNPHAQPEYTKTQLP